MNQTRTAQRPRQGQSQARELGPTRQVLGEITDANDSGVQLDLGDWYSYSRYADPDQVDRHRVGDLVQVGTDRRRFVWTLEVLDEPEYSRRAERAEQTGEPPAAPQREQRAERAADAPRPALSGREALSARQTATNCATQLVVASGAVAEVPAPQLAAAVIELARELERYLRD